MVDVGTLSRQDLATWCERFSRYHWSLVLHVGAVWVYSADLDATPRPYSRTDPDLERKLLRELEEAAKAGQSPAAEKGAL
jgi:hypothetical protein